MRKTVSIEILKDTDTVWGATGLLKVEDDSFHKKEISVTANGDFFIDGAKQTLLDDKKVVNVKRIKRDGMLNYKYQIRQDGPRIIISEFGGKYKDPDVINEDDPCFLRLMVTVNTERPRSIDLQTFSSNVDDDVDTDATDATDADNVSA